MGESDKPLHRYSTSNMARDDHRSARQYRLDGERPLTYCRREHGFDDSARIGEDLVPLGKKARNLGMELT